MIITKEMRDKSRSTIIDSADFFLKILKGLLSKNEFIAINLVTGEQKKNGYYMCSCDLFDTIEFYSLTFTDSFIKDTLFPGVDGFIQSNIDLLMLPENYLAVYVTKEYISLDICKWVETEQAGKAIVKNNRFFYSLMDCNGYIID